MLGQTVYLSFINLCGRSFNFLLYFLVANQYGASNNTDWFFLVYAIIYYFITIFARSIESVLVPLLNKNGLNSVDSLFHFTTLIGIWSTIGVFGVIILIGFLLAPIGFDISPPEHYSLSLAICLILSVQPSLALFSSFFSSYLQACQKYTIPTLQLAIRSLGVLAVLVLPWCKSILCLALAYLVGELTRLAVLGKITFRESTKQNLTKTKEINLISADIFRRAGWIALALCSAQLNPAIDMAMVGGLGEGSATLVSYAESYADFLFWQLTGL